MTQAAPPPPAATLRRGSACTLHLEIRLPDGTLALSTRDGAPLELTLGDGTLTPGLEDLLLGLAAGQRTRFIAQGDDLYGPRDPGAVNWLPLADFPQDHVTTAGQVVAFDTPGGQELAGLVLAVEGDLVQVDLNHPLSGRPLNIEVEILAVTPDPA
ncbi:MAG TPA: FKBP-type peptidyl-prolyl cis-trans isomerase [Chromatiaceae bacterium]|nr:FKBP-type peptidyl-prolyl cis-trans isomerase [Chromatiaceae bacterium]